jgi:hypothetical protein
MRLATRALVCLLLLLLAATAGARQVYVHGYYRKDGKYVQPYYRKSPDRAAKSTRVRRPRKSLPKAARPPRPARVRPPRVVVPKPKRVVVPHRMRAPKGSRRGGK